MKIETYIRVPEQLDISFIYSSWLKSFRNRMGNVSNLVYYQEQKQLIDRIMKDSEIFISCNPEDLNQIYGYIVFKTIGKSLIVHYVYTKQTYRKFGICKELYKCVHPGKLEDGCLSTHSSIVIESIADKYNILFNPYFLLKGTR